MPASSSLATVDAPPRAGADAPAQPHREAGHGRTHSEEHGGHHAHPPAGPAIAGRIPVSVLRLSLAVRLGIAGGLLAVLWTAVALVVGAEP